MADAGSQQILALLDEGSPALARSYKRLAKAIKRMPKRDDGVPAPIAFAALSDIRGFFAGLSGEISAIDTPNPAKADVLAALEVFDKANAKTEEGLQEGASKDGLKSIRKARKLAKRANRDLKDAKAGLK